jgi:nitroreductase
MAGFEVNRAKKTLAIPDGYDPVAMFAIGYPGDIEMLPESFVRSEQASRSRKDLDEFLFQGEWG